MREDIIKEYESIDEQELIKDLKELRESESFKKNYDNINQKKQILQHEIQVLEDEIQILKGKIQSLNYQLINNNSEELTFNFNSNPKELASLLLKLEKYKDSIHFELERSKEVSTCYRILDLFDNPNPEVRADAIKFAKMFKMLGERVLSQSEGL
jgi:TolA-binding protein